MARAIAGQTRTGLEVGSGSVMASLPVFFANVRRVSSIRRSRVKWDRIGEHDFRQPDVSRVPRAGLRSVLVDPPPRTPERTAHRRGLCLLRVVGLALLRPAPRVEPAGLFARPGAGAADLAVRPARPPLDE